MNIEDSEELRAYLLQRGVRAAAEASICALGGGVSSRTVRVDFPCGESWVLKQALPLLRVPVHWASSPSRSAREAEGARVLARLLPAGSVPTLLFEDNLNHVFAMTLAPGVPWKELLLGGCLQSQHFAAAGRMLACIHSESRLASGEFSRDFWDMSFFESLRLEPYYEYSASQVPSAAPFLRSLCERARTCRLSLVHGDFSPKNLLVNGERLVLLDHEVIHFGDPAFDTGFILAHFLSKLHHLPSLRPELASGIEAFWRTYLQDVARVGWGPSMEEGTIAHTLGCLLARVAGRSQLEYLSPPERWAQQRACLALIVGPPMTVAELTGRFVVELQRCR